MRNKGWLAIALATVLAVALSMVSCTRKVVQTRSQTQPVSTTGPEVAKAEARKTESRKPEVQKAPEGSTEKAGPPGQPESDRSRAEAGAREAAKWVFLNEHVHFAFNSSLLSDEARRILRAKAEYLRTNPNMMITVEGHCDERGTNAFNFVLGERRAESVKMFLVDLGIGHIRLNTVSYGKDRPVAAGHDEAAWARNRRAQIVIN